MQSYDVEEDTIALYLKANFAGDNWFANVGVRWITTDTTARTAIDSIVFVDDPTPEVPTSSPDVTYSPAEPLTRRAATTSCCRRSMSATGCARTCCCGAPSPR